MDVQERERLSAVEAQLLGLIASMDRLRAELTDYVRHERYIWIERIVIGAVSLGIGIGVNRVLGA